MASFKKVRLVRRRRTTTTAPRTDASATADMPSTTTGEMHEAQQVDAVCINGQDGGDKIEGQQQQQHGGGGTDIAIATNGQLEAVEEEQGDANANGQNTEAQNVSVEEQEEKKNIVPLLINNESIIGSTTFEVRDPVTNKVLHHCAGASPTEDVERATTTAAAAFRSSWARTLPYQRRDILMKAADIMASRKEELIDYQNAETGADRIFVGHTLSLGVEMLRDFAGRVSSMQAGVVPQVTQLGEGAMILKQPYGVILGIAPW